MKKKTRKLLSNRLIPELVETKKLEINTHCPEKWVSFDLETGELWVGSDKGWKKVTKAVNKEVVAIVKRLLEKESNQLLKMS